MEQEEVKETTPVCNRSVSTDGWHWIECGRKAKWRWLSGISGDRKVYRCGLHARKRPPDAEAL